MRHTGPSLQPVQRVGPDQGTRDAVDAGRADERLGPADRRAGWRRSPRSRAVRYPFLDSHPQHDLAKAQMSAGGTVVTFELDGGKDEAFRLLDALRIIDISNNLGDSKSLITHPATTTHRRLGEPRPAGGRDHRRHRPDLGRAGGPRRPGRRPRQGPRPGLVAAGRRPASGGQAERRRGRDEQDRHDDQPAQQEPAGGETVHAGRAAALPPEQRRERGPQGEQRPAVDAEQQGDQPGRRAVGDRLEGEVGRQVVDPVGRQRADAGDAAGGPASSRRCRPARRASAVEPMPAGRSTDDEQTPTPSTTSQGTWTCAASDRLRTRARATSTTAARCRPRPG